MTVAQAPPVFKARVDRQGRLWVGTSRSLIQNLQARTLGDFIPGLEIGRQSVIVVTTLPEHVRSYHTYEGGSSWTAKLPQTCPANGAKMEVSVQILSPEAFVRNLKSFSYPPDAPLGLPYSTVQAKAFKLTGASFEMVFSQAPPIEGTDWFKLSGRTSRKLRCSAKSANLQFEVSDFFGFRRILALNHDGQNSPILRIKASGQFYTVSSLHFDGVRLRVRFQLRKWNPNVVTMYLASPNSLYSLKGLQNIECGSLGSGISRALMVRKVESVRELERFILKHGTNYSVGRLGAEIAYCVATRILGLRRVILNEPSRGGKDLFTLGNTAVIQSRLLTRTQFKAGQQRVFDIRRELRRMVRKLGQDFRYNPAAMVGYAIISYVTRTSEVQSIAAEVPNDATSQTPDFNGGPGRI